MKAKQDKLYQFMMDELGGEEEVLFKYFTNIIGDIASEDQTLEELFAEAKAQGFEEQLRQMKITELANIVNPVAFAGQAGVDSRPEPAKRSRRMTKEEKAQLYQGILDFVRENPWCQNSDIAAAVDTDSKKLGIHLRSLKNNGDLQSVGKLTKMRYAMPQEKTKPPKE